MVKIRRLIVLTLCVIAILVVAQFASSVADWSARSSHLSNAAIACNSGAGAGGGC